MTPSDSGPSPLQRSNVGYRDIQQLSLYASGVLLVASQMMVSSAARRSLWTLILLVVVVGLPRQAAASDKAAAQSLFLAGKALMNDGQVDEACPKFAESVRLFATVGATLNLARCHEMQGKTASAWSEYAQAEALALREKDKWRARIAREHAADLKQKLSMLTIDVPSPVPGLQVFRDGSLVGAASFGVSVAVDPGAHLIEARAEQYAPWSFEVTVGKDGDAKKVKVPALEPIPLPPPPPTSIAPLATVAAPPPPPLPPPPVSDERRAVGPQRILAAVGWGLAAAGVLGGAALGVAAKSDWDEAQYHCREGLLCDAEGVALGEDAGTLADLSTAAFVMAGAGLTVGTVLWLTAPQPAAPAGTGALQLQILSSTSPRSATLTLQGRFR